MERYLGGETIGDSFAFTSLREDVLVSEELNNQIHPLEGGGFAISSNRVWLPGAYASLEAAQEAFRLPMEALIDLKNAVNGTQKRGITIDDVSESRKKFWELLPD